MFPRKGAPEASSGFTIARARRYDTRKDVVLKGNFGPVSAKQTIKVLRWEDGDDPKFGPFIKVWELDHSDPTDKNEIVEYLNGIDGVGADLALKIVNALGADCLKRIDEDPSLLHSIDYTPVNAAVMDTSELASKWASLRAEQRALQDLKAMGVDAWAARAAIKAFGPSTAADRIRRDPYVLCELDGISFGSADRVGRRLGIGEADERRIGAGIKYLLDKAESEGSICLDLDGINERAAELLSSNGEKAPAEIIERSLDQMLKTGRLYIEDVGDGVQRVYTRENFLVETRLYELLEKRLRAEPIKPPDGLAKPKSSLSTDEQWEAVEKGMSEPLSILTGSAGTGKTTALRELLDTCDRHQHKYMLMAPTGKAAKRMHESTGRDATTIHMALGGNGTAAPDTRYYDPNKIQSLAETDVVVVDEASMLDMKLAERLLSHIGPETRLVLVGDPNQLPAVGAGSVLFDLIESERVPTTQLTTIFRQAEDSLLVVNANRIRESKEPFWTKEEAEKALGHKVREDFEFIEADNAAEAQRKVLEASKRLTDELAVSPDEVIVTAPTKRGDDGVNGLNESLRALHNPGTEVIVDTGEYRVHSGDRVMNTRNRYRAKKEQDIMNGDVGTIASYDEKHGYVWVDFDGIGPVRYSKRDLTHGNLIPAFAATTHKLQGSEAPGVVIPYVRKARNLSRNMIYTAMTRGKEKCVMIGRKDVIKAGVKIDGTARKTTLDLRVGKIRARVRARWKKFDIGERYRSGWMNPFLSQNAKMLPQEEFDRA